MQAQQVLVSATSFIVDLNKALYSQSGMHYMYERMQQLDSWTTSVLAQMDMSPMISPESDFGDGRETITAQSIRSISRIKLSRYVLQPSSFLIAPLIHTLQCSNQSTPITSFLRHPHLHQTTLRFNRRRSKQSTTRGQNFSTTPRKWSQQRWLLLQQP